MPLGHRRRGPGQSGWGVDRGKQGGWAEATCPVITKPLGSLPSRLASPLNLILSAQKLPGHPCCLWIKPRPCPWHPGSPCAGTGSVPPSSEAVS